MNTYIVRTLVIAVPLMVAVTCAEGLAYANAEQMLRQGANEPQVQLAESIAAEIGSGAPPQAFVQGGAAPLETSQTPFILIADASGKTLGATGSVAGALPTLPAGVFGAHKDSFGTNDNRITWQPAKNIREALVITPFTSGSTTGYVAVGRSLRETENQESRLTERTMLGWLASMAAILIASVAAAWLLSRP